MKSSLIYDWIADKGGGEKVVEDVLSLFPSTIYTLFYLDKHKNQYLKQYPIYTSFLQKIPYIYKVYRNLLPLFPWAVSSLRPKEKLVIAISHTVAHSIKVKEDQLLICYCFTPMRFAWDLREDYLQQVSGIKKLICKTVLHFMRKWDYKRAQKHQYLIANSHYIAERIEKCWGKKAEVIYPPVDVERFEIGEEKEDYYLTVSRMVSQKKVDVIVEAFSNMPEKKLIVIGDGPDLIKIKKRATSNIKILGYQEDKTVALLMKKAKAFVYCAEEDFGIVKVEAQASGTPVLAFGKGGAKETVIENVTGLFFDEQTKESIIKCIEEFETKEKNFDAKMIRKHAEKFSRERFLQEFKNYVEKVVNSQYENHSSLRR